MSWTGIGNKKVREMFNRDRKELEKERFLQREEKQTNLFDGLGEKNE